MEFGFKWAELGLDEDHDLVCRSYRLHLFDVHHARPAKAIVGSHVYENGVFRRAFLRGGGKVRELSP